MLDRTQAAILLDFYGKLLTGRQREVMAAYYEDDLSIGEIAENLGISRPGVHDLLHRSVNQLQSMEKQLGLAFRDQQRRQCLEQVNALITKLGEAKISPQARLILQELQVELAKLISI